MTTVAAQKPPEITLRFELSRTIFFFTKATKEECGILNSSGRGIMDLSPPHFLCN
jgi:hypothetical protein